MSDDLQKTNVAEGKPVTIDDIRLAIVGDKDKLLLINVFDNLINDNNRLKAELEASRKVKDEANV